MISNKLMKSVSVAAFAAICAFGSGQTFAAAPAPVAQGDIHAFDRGVGPFATRARCREARLAHDKVPGIKTSSCYKEPSGWYYQYWK